MADSFNEQMEAFLASNPQAQHLYEQITSLFEDDTDETIELDIVTINNTDYLALHAFLIRGTTYYHLLPEENIAEPVYARVSAKQDEEHLTLLEEGTELELVKAYELKYLLREIKRKQDYDRAHKGQ